MKEINLQNLMPHLLYQFKSEHELEKTIEKVGQIFNHMRENIESYANDEKMISAYVAYYLSTNIPKLSHVLDMVGIDLNDYENFYDIGTGPGTFLIAAHAMNPKLNLVGIDKSDLMLAQAMQILKGLGVNSDYSLGKKVGEFEKKKSLVLFSHSLNEMSENEVGNYLKLIEDQDVLIIEPGTMEVFNKLMPIREKMIERGYEVKFPCHSNKACQLNPATDWCHQYIMVKHNDEVERLTQKLHRNRRLMPLSVFFYSKSAEAQTCMARLIRVHKPTKFSIEWEVCMSDHSIQRLEIPIKHYSKKEQKELLKVTAGSAVNFEVIKELSDRLRVKLI